MARKSDAGRKSGTRKGRRTAAGPTIQPITSEQALEFIRALQSRFRKTPKTDREKVQLQEYLAQFPDQQLKAVGRRVHSDLMLRPPRTIRPEDFEKRKRRAYGERRGKPDRHER
jgi:hypothetical protein